MSTRIIENPFRAAVKLHDPLTLEHLRESRRAISTYCLKPGVMCGKYLELARSIAYSTALLRLYDLKGLEYTGLDSSIIKLIESIAEIYAKLLSGLIVIVGEHALVKFKASIEIDGRAYRRGEITKLSLDKLVVLTIAGLVEPVESIASLS